MKFTWIILVCCCALTGLSLAGGDGGASDLETLNHDTLSLRATNTTITKTHNKNTTTKTPTTNTTITKTPTTNTTKTPTTNTTKTPTTNTTKTPTTKTPTTNTTKTPTTNTTKTPTTNTTKTPTTNTTKTHTTNTTKTPTTNTTKTPTTNTTKTPTTNTTKTTTKPTRKPITTPTPTVPPAPTPPTTLRVGTYNITNSKSHVVCVLAKMAVQIRLLGPKINGTFIVQPNQTTVDGWCNNTMANLTLLFTEGFITFLYNRNVSKNRVYVSSLSFNLTYAFNKGEKRLYRASNQSTQLFAAGIGRCYSCSGDSLYLGNSLYLDVSQDKMQAFNLTKNSFGYSESCSADTKGYRVAVAVGVTLLIVVVIVVVIYIWHRKRNGDGYQPL